MPSQSHLLPISHPSLSHFSLTSHPFLTHHINHFTPISNPPLIYSSPISHQFLTHVSFISHLSLTHFSSISQPWSISHPSRTHISHSFLTKLTLVTRGLGLNLILVLFDLILYLHFFQNSEKIINVDLIAIFDLIFSKSFIQIYRVYHIEMVVTKWLWGVEESIILLNHGA